jgi:hypothetical protein
MTNNEYLKKHFIVWGHGKNCLGNETYEYECMHPICRPYVPRDRLTNPIQAMRHLEEWHQWAMENRND